MTILNNILAVSVREFRVMCTRYSILMVLSGGIFLYGLLYNYMYAPNVVRNAPVAVVDMSQTFRSGKSNRQQNDSEIRLCPTHLSEVLKQTA